MEEISALFLRGWDTVLKSADWITIEQASKCTYFKTKPIARKLRRECQNAAFQPCDLPCVVLVGTPQGTGQNLHETRL